MVFVFLFLTYFALKFWDILVAIVPWEGLPVPAPCSALGPEVSAQARMAPSRGKEALSPFLLSFFPPSVSQRLSRDPSPSYPLAFLKAWVAAQAVGEKRESSWSCTRVDTGFLTPCNAGLAFIPINHLSIHCPVFSAGVPYYTKSLWFHHIAILPENTWQENT